MRILFLSQRVPYPPNRGDKITTWRLIERLSRNHEVSVLAFAHDEDDEDAARELRRKGFDTRTYRVHPKWDRVRALPLLLTGKPLTLGVYGSRALQREVNIRVPEVDLAYAYSSSMGAFLLEHSELRRIMHFAELDSDKWRQYAESTPFPANWIYRREWKTLFRFEQALARQVDRSVFCTPLEEKIFQERIPGAPSIVLPNGVDLETFRPQAQQAEPGHLVFVGVMDYFPNVDGCLWFVREILPRLRKSFPDVRLSIVGSHPAPEIQRLSSEAGVEVTGFVDDTRDYLRRASISIAPLRIARGIQNKVLEAMAMGLPVVGTTSATQGVNGSPGRDYLVAEDPDSFAQAVESLLRSPERARGLGATARKFVEDHYDWEVCLQPLDELVTSLAPQESPV